ncbi:hypothetical protein [Rubrimonas sp.]|uniref:hypothetical protein n=1 Tax=Rubrimonas sp. TaxID=2036015 RepID=UPI002FDCFFEF
MRGAFVIHLVVGMPGPFTDWCAAIALGALARRVQRVALEPVGRLQDLARAALRGDAEAMVCFGADIDDALAHELQVARRPILIAAADPGAVTTLLIEGGHAHPAEAFRIALRASIGLMRLRNADHVLRLEPAACAADPAGAAMALADHLGLPVGRDEAEALVGAHAALLAPLAALATDRTSVAAQLAARVGDADMAEAMAATLAVYGAMERAGAPARINVDPVLLLTGEPPHAPLRGPVDVTGRPCHVFFGGYIPLLPGDWEVEAIVALSPSAAEGSFSFEVASTGPGEPEPLAQTPLTPRMAGQQRLVCAFRVGSAQGLVQVRLFSARAMFDGLVELRSLRFDPLKGGAGDRAVP